MKGFIASCTVQIESWTFNEPEQWWAIGGLSVPNAYIYTLFRLTSGRRHLNHTPAHSLRLHIFPTHTSLAAHRIKVPYAIAPELSINLYCTLHGTAHNVPRRLFN